MSVQLPNGVIISIANSYGEAKTVSALTNADPAVATCTAHGFSDGDYVEITSGWNAISDKVVRVDDSATNAFSYEGIDTSNTTKYPAGSGTGSVRKIAGWSQIQQITDVSTSGGDMQFATWSFLENDYESQKPTQSSAQSLTLTIADDPALPGYQVLKRAADSRDVTAIKISLPNGSEILFNGYVSFNETPNMTKGEIMTVTATISLLTRPVRY